MSDPDQIRAEIERTRMHLDTDVNALADKVSPDQIAERQKEKVRNRVTGVKESIMGGVRSAQDSVSSAADSVQHGNGADGAVATAKGHPIVVGLVAFGAGWLLSSLLPSTDTEQQLARRAKDEAAPLTDEVEGTAKSAGRQLVDDLKEPAQQAAQHVKETAQDAAGTVQDEGRSAAQDVRGQAQESKDAVQGRAAGARDELQGEARDARGQARS